MRRLLDKYQSDLKVSLRNLCFYDYTGHWLMRLVGKREKYGQIL